MNIFGKFIIFTAIGVMLASCGGSSGSSTNNESGNTVNEGGSTVNKAGMATLNWLPPTQNTDSSNLGDLTGYKIYYSEQADNLTEIISIDNINLTSYVIENLNTNTTYYFAITAVNSQSVESTYSSIVSKTIN